MSIQISGADQARVETAYSAMRDCNELERALVIDRINRDTPKRIGRPRGSKNKVSHPEPNSFLGNPSGGPVCDTCANGTHGLDSEHATCSCPCHNVSLRERTYKLRENAIAAQRPGDLGALMGEVDARIELELIKAERPE